ncbi:hypothetical protein [Mailhella sp.]|uniref:hypothetical protein n=1 Tax=Mailhella sp. TaxID=1981029 RepID=UPI003AB60012
MESAPFFTEGPPRGNRAFRKKIFSLSQKAESPSRKHFFLVFQTIDSKSPARAPPPFPQKSTPRPSSGAIRSRRRSQKSRAALRDPRRPKRFSFSLHSHGTNHYRPSRPVVTKRTIAAAQRSFSPEK